VRMREREEAMQLITTGADQTCERDFDRTLDDLLQRDEALLRNDFSAERPLIAVVGFDGADNFCHGTLRLADYAEGVANESELKAAQLFVAMGDDRFPRLERTVAPRIAPAASARKFSTVRGKQVPTEVTLCLDLSASRSAYGRRAGKNAHTSMTDVHQILKLPPNCTSARAFALIGDVAPWLAQGG
jgi:hypothetical protein